MLESYGESLTRWTIRIAVALYLVRIGTDVAGSARRYSERIARFSWTGSLVFYLIHVCCAFQFYHDWSHTAAYTHTARTVQQVVGINWGGGIYFNYAFTLLWIGDALAWWRRGGGYWQESPRRTMALHSVFGFMMLNATVVFGPGYWTWIAVGFGVILLGLSTLRPRQDTPQNGR